MKLFDFYSFQPPSLSALAFLMFAAATWISPINWKWRILNVVMLSDIRRHLRHAMDTCVCEHIWYTLWFVTITTPGNKLRIYLYIKETGKIKGGSNMQFLPICLPVISLARSSWLKVALIDRSLIKGEAPSFSATFPVPSHGWQAL